jgi:hypothetical protein
MSDTVQAPPPPPPAAPTGEVPINPNPTNTPAPLSGTPPPLHRHEVVAKAFEKVERARVERKGPAQARMGHNQPPEGVEAEKPDLRGKNRGDNTPPESPLNLRKRPSEQEPPAGTASSTTPARERGEGGRFASKAERGQARQSRSPLPETARYRNPPQRMSNAAKAEWARTPESVRGDFHRMHREFAAAHQRYRADHATMNSIRPYHDLATRQGTNLPTALRNYVGIENKLRGDLIGGLDVIVNNLNLRTPDGRRLGLRDVAYYIASQSPQQHQMTQARNHQAALQQQMQQIQHNQQQLARQQAQMRYMQAYHRTRSAVDRFAEANPRLDELAPFIERELAFGFDLPTAYRRAALLRPTAAQTRGTATAPQTRKADRSISGAPDGGVANGAMRKKSTDRRGSVVNAMRRVAGSL